MTAKPTSQIERENAERQTKQQRRDEIYLVSLFALIASITLILLSR